MVFGLEANLSGLSDRDKATLKEAEKVVNKYEEMITSDFDRDNVVRDVMIQAQSEVYGLQGRLSAYRKEYRKLDAKVRYQRLKKLLLDAKKAPIVYEMRSRFETSVNMNVKFPLFCASKDQKKISTVNTIVHIATGAYAKVYKATLVSYSFELEGWEPDSSIVLKEPTPIANSSLTEIWRRFERQARFWESLSHPNVIPLYGVFYEVPIGSEINSDTVPSTENRPYLACPLASNGNVWEYLRSNVERQAETHRLIEGIIGGIAYMHSGETTFNDFVDPEPTRKYRISHGDIKPDNLLINGNHEIWVSDFDIAGEARINGSLSSYQTGSEKYAAPELLGYELDPDEQENRHVKILPADIYALGITIWELMTLSYAARFNNRKDMAPKPHPRISARLYELLKACWSEVPDDRPTAEQLKQQYLQLPTAERRIQSP